MLIIRRSAPLRGHEKFVEKQQKARAAYQKNWR